MLCRPFGDLSRVWYIAVYYVGPLVTVFSRAWLCYVGPLVTLAVFGYIM